ncbi:M56 family metallopeptidase [Ferruginibacter sp. SUN106]|uniref:M56 family metallopeptidase n=1 Tax=Ferruginibacter sp. SUN106 TaxID=2978348 RepID=UPI003D368E7C
MHFLSDYILKLSVSLAVVFLFYYFILRKLTFYNHNRWYLLGYTILSFFIPFINIAAVLQKNNWHSSEIINWVPTINNNIVTGLPVTHLAIWGIKEIVLLIIVAGMLVMLTRLLLQVFSFKKMLRKAEPVTTDGMNLYQVNDNIIPFSFGNAIFINRHLHTEEELQEIIHHEFVHVKQRHSIDIIWSELLCIACWYNPFVWLLKRSIRQNLEFIADGKVLENGINKKEYQYLLLKVIGNNQYSIATQFNFSSLKKRIAMMNKTKSAKRQLIRLLFLLPATAVLLLAFRSKWNAAAKATTTDKTVAVAGLVVDAKTLQPLADAGIYCKEKNISIRTDAKGYYLLQLPFENKELEFTLQITKEGYQPFQQTEHWGNFTQDYIYNRYSKSIEHFGLSKSSDKGFSWLGGASGIEDLEYAAVAAKLSEVYKWNTAYGEKMNLRDTFPKRKQPNSKGYLINIADKKGNATVVIKDKAGTEVKRVLLSEWNENAEKYESIYGELPPPPPPPTPPAAPLAPPTPDMPGLLAPPAPDMPAPPPPPAAVGIQAAPAVAPVPPAAPGIQVTPALAPPPPPAAPPAPPAPPKLPANVKRLDIDNNKATIWLKNGQKETYDLNNAEQKEKFEKKYGEITKPPTPPDATVIPGKNNPTVYSGEIKIMNSNKLLILDGKELASNNTRLTGKFNMLTLTKHAAAKKYGPKGENGAIEITTVQ